MKINLIIILDVIHNLNNDGIPSINLQELPQRHAEDNREYYISPKPAYFPSWKIHHNKLALVSHYAPHCSVIYLFQGLLVALVGYQDFLVVCEISDIVLKHMAALFS